MRNESRAPARGYHVMHTHTYVQTQHSNLVLALTITWKEQQGGDGRTLRQLNGWADAVGAVHEKSVTIFYWRKAGAVQPEENLGRGARVFRGKGRDAERLQQV